MLTRLLVVLLDSLAEDLQIELAMNELCRENGKMCRPLLLFIPKLLVLTCSFYPHFWKIAREREKRW